ncbi:MAG: carboxypeptidase-like regulatory domain-containing protein [Candidatus Acidiferrales bacterium]
MRLKADDLKKGLDALGVRRWQQPSQEILFGTTGPPKYVVEPGPIHAKSLAGTVSDFNGVPIPGTVVLRLLEGPSNEKIERRTNQRGEFSFDGLPCAQYHLRFTAIGFAIKTVTVVTCKSNDAIQIQLPISEVIVPR